MSTSRRSIALWLAAGAVAALHPAPAHGQAGAITAAFTVGGRLRIDSLDPHSRGKLEEYRHIPEKSPFLEAVRLGYSPHGFTGVTLVAREVGERDQSAWIAAREPGRWSGLLQWDRIPHTFSTTARSLGATTAPGVYTLPSPRPDTATWNRAGYLGPVRTRWDPVRLGVAITPNARWQLKAEYTWIHKEGDRPMGMAFGSPGNNFREIAEPIDQTMQSLRLSEGFSSRRMQLLLTYELSLFRNALTSVVSDNPLVATDTPSSGSSRGRSALAPGNVAHTVVLTGAATLPAHTRVAGSASMSWRRQDEAFLPATINGAISNPLLANQAGSLDGRVRTASFFVSATSRPLPRLTLNGRARHYSLTDQTEALELYYVNNDRSFVTTPADAERFPYAKSNADVSASYRLPGSTRLTAGWQFERWERAAPLRNTRHTNEHTARLALDLGPAEWLQVRGSVFRSWRRIPGEYLATSDAQLPELRRFDQAVRNRDRWEVQAFLTPTDNLSLSGLVGRGRADYPESLYGLQRERSTLLGGDAEWVPVPRLSVGLHATRETFLSRQKSRSRENAIRNNLTYDWVSENDDYITTLGASLSGVIVPDRLEVGAMLELSDARLKNHAFNPNGPPTGGTATQNANATAGDWPDITQKWLPASAFLTYRVRADWAVTLTYMYDQFKKKDFRTDGLKPATGSDIFMGNDFRDYTAQFLSLSLSFRPRLLRPGRSLL